MRNVKLSVRKMGLIMLAVTALISLSLFVSLSYSVTPSGEIWTCAASTFVVDEDSLTKYEVSGSNMRFKGTNTGYIYARVNVVNPSDSGDTYWNYLSVVYSDPDGTGTAYRVRVLLYKVKIRGTGLGVSSSVVIFNSNSYAETGLRQRDVAFVHDWDFFNYAYYFSIDLYRTSSTSNPTIRSLQLYYVMP